MDVPPHDAWLRLASEEDYPSESYRLRIAIQALWTQATLSASAPCMQVLCKPGSQAAKSNFQAELYCLTKEEGGRHTPFFSDYRPQLFIRTADVTGAHIASSAHVHGRISKAWRRHSTALATFTTVSPSNCDLASRALPGTVRTEW